MSLLRVKFHKRCPPWRQELLNCVVKHTRTLLCQEDDPRMMCHGHISSEQSKIYANPEALGSFFFVLEWTVAGQPLLVNQDDLQVFLNNLNAVPENVVLVTGELTHAKKHPHLNIWWTTMGQTSEPMHGLYIQVPWEVEPEILERLSLKRCQCLVRPTGLNFYHVPPEIKLLHMLRMSEALDLVPLVTSLILNEQQERGMSNLTILELFLDYDMAHKIEQKYLREYNFMQVSNLNQAVQVRIYLTNKGSPSFILQEFDGSYLVMYQAIEGVRSDVSRLPNGLKHLQDLPEIDGFEIELLGWPEN